MKNGSLHTLKIFFPLILGCVCLLCACTRTPGVEIKNPSTGTVVDEGGAVLFKASVTAGEGRISEVIWLSSLDGVIWSSTYDNRSSSMDMSFTKADLSRGQHTIYCYAYGDSGFTGIDSTTLTVGEKSGEERLFALIASPRDNQDFNAGDSITCYGAAADPADGSLEGASLVWSIDTDQSLGIGNEFTAGTLPAGTHSIVLTATNSQGLQQKDSVTISVAGSAATTTTEPGATTSTPDLTTSTVTGGESTTTVPGGNTTTSTGNTTTSVVPATTTTSVSDYCTEAEPILCVDPDYSSDQYWCCEEGTICGKVSLDNEGNPYGTCLPGSSSSSTTAASATTTSTPPAETTLYLSPNPQSDILFYVHHKDGTMVYYKGFINAGNMKLNHVSFDDGSAIIFNNDFIPVQWITEGLTAAVYTLNDEPFDPHAAYHEAALGEELESFTADIYPANPGGILTQMQAKTGITFNDAADFLSQYSISSFSDLAARAKQAGADQPRYIAAAVGFSAAAAYLSIDSALFDQKQPAVFQPLSNPMAQYLVQFAVSLLSSKFNGQYGPQPPTDPADPGVHVYLCRGQSSISQICHYMFFKAKCNPNGTCEASGACVSLCLTSMKCFTDICLPKVLSAQSAEDFKNHFYD